MKLARVRHRVMAALLDLCIVCSFLLIITLFKLPFIISMFLSDESVVTTKFIIDVFRWGIIMCVLFLIYYVVVPVLLKGQTFGKKVFKLKIVKENEENVEPMTMFYRDGVGSIFIHFASLGITAIASIIIMSLREDKKSLGDILAKTKVVDLYESGE